MKIVKREIKGEQQLFIENYRIRLLEHKEIDIAQKILNQYLGDGLYQLDLLYRTLFDPNYFFYVIEDDIGIVGLFYFHMDFVYNLGSVDGFYEGILDGICEKGEKVCIYRAFSLVERARGQNLAGKITEIFTEKMFDKGADVIIGSAWAKGEFVPAHKLFVSNGFTKGNVIPKPWNNCFELNCPYCKTVPCECDAILYYKKRGSAK